ncbi:MAG: hypothetical protein RSA01_01170 [Clostridium sp.]
MEVINKNVQTQEVGGVWACLVGCGSFCFMVGGATTYVAAVATAL